jgi:hypothetical protein
MQFKVPQNIDLQDKVIGPMTMIQFLYVLGGGVADYLLFIAIGSGVVFWVLAIPIALIALALAFLKIQEQPLSHFITAGLVYYNRPKQRRWQRSGSNVMTVRDLPQTKKKVVMPTKRVVTKSELEKLAYTLDTHNPQQAK